ncbi:sensor histidine kinase [Aminobacter aganoensis]|uniref:histidine kinase n=1 Tax=Aminobacter aganoensis TaxID=83264 RepID=A0A7X0FA07_9HYPH|nr:HAMP domain-containing sensor histidine kinase [Aminobacter aganoensis]MBB6355684.1 signal transduction histidine kinase [Aminobacter aganoensis]
MTRLSSTSRAALPFICLGIALVLCGWTFFRSEQYRAESDLRFGQTYEIQWRTTQIRERLARIHGDLRLARATGTREARLGREIFLLEANIAQLLKLEYAREFLRPRDIELLEGLQTIAQTSLRPVLDDGAQIELALSRMPDLEQRMFEVSGTAVAHAETLNTALHIAASASRNRFLFASALALAALGYTIIHYRNVLVRRRDQQMRSFSTLYVHMTRSRVTALRLFLDYQDEASVRHPEMLSAAKEAVQQLETITLGLNSIAYADDDTPREPLSAVLAALMADKISKPAVLADDHAGAVSVPSMQVRLLIDELLQNAEAAVKDSPNAHVAILARLTKASMSRKPKLSLEVVDNGPGMTSEVLKKAANPFFSTKAGSHTGLGLTGCAQMVAALKGKISIASQPGKGTSVKVVLPIQSG